MKQNTYQKWQYHCELVNGTISRSRLDQFGANGWELCGTVATCDPPSDLSSGWPGVVTYYFKRQIK